jgi:hypothetical protein
MACVLEAGIATHCLRDDGFRAAVYRSRVDAGAWQSSPATPALSYGASVWRNAPTGATGGSVPDQRVGAEAKGADTSTED